MAVLLLQPRHLAWYRDLIALFLKYGPTDLVARARLEEVLSEDLPPADKDGATPESFVADLERLGPTFVKLGQLLSTRPDLLPEPYLLALSRLQDDVPPSLPVARAPMRRPSKIEWSTLRGGSRPGRSSASRSPGSGWCRGRTRGGVAGDRS